MHLYLTRNCVKVSSQHLDINEHLTVTAVPLEEGKRKINWQRNHVHPVCSKTLQKIFTPMNYNRSEQQLESFASM
jgi:hypothetical protein